MMKSNSKVSHLSVDDWMRLAIFLNSGVELTTVSIWHFNARYLASIDAFTFQLVSSLTVSMSRSIWIDKRSSKTNKKK